ncbi:MAG: hypothetical protein ACLRSW_06365 [Christensenellaceae bacterium]
MNCALSKLHERRTDDSKDRQPPVRTKGRTITNDKPGDESGGQTRKTATPRH